MLRASWNPPMMPEMDPTMMPMQPAFQLIDSISTADMIREPMNPTALPATAENAMEQQITDLSLIHI